MNFWSWGGKYIGQSTNDTLYSYTGTPIGMFIGKELYGFDGLYLGEIMSNNRIIVNISKKSYRKSVGYKPCNHSSFARYCDYAGYAMYAGYEDFVFKG